MNCLIWQKLILNRRIKNVETEIDKEVVKEFCIKAKCQKIADDFWDCEMACPLYLFIDFLKQRGFKIVKETGYGRN